MKVQKSGLKQKVCSYGIGFFVLLSGWDSFYAGNVNSRMFRLEPTDDCSPLEALSVNKTVKEYLASQLLTGLTDELGLAGNFLLYGQGGGVDKTTVARSCCKSLQDRGIPAFSSPICLFLNFYNSKGVEDIELVFTELRRHAPCLLYIPGTDFILQQKPTWNGDHEDKSQRAFLRACKRLREENTKVSLLLTAKSVPPNETEDMGRFQSIGING